MEFDKTYSGHLFLVYVKSVCGGRVLHYSVPFLLPVLQRICRDILKAAVLLELNFRLN